MAKRDLSWEPYVRLDEGLKATIRYFEILLSSGGCSAQLDALNMPWNPVIEVIEN